MKAAATLQVEFIKNCLKAGEKRAVILAKLQENYPTLSERTLDRRIGLAQKALRAEANVIAQNNQQALDTIVSTGQYRVLSVAERLDILSKIALGELKIKQYIFGGAEVGNIEVEVEPNYLDRRGAIAELNKMFGDYAPEKKEINIGGKKDAAPVNTIILSNGTQIPFG